MKLVKHVAETGQQTTALKQASTISRCAHCRLECVMWSARDAILTSGSGSVDVVLTVAAGSEGEAGDEESAGEIGVTGDVATAGSCD